MIWAHDGLVTNERRNPRRRPAKSSTWTKVAVALLGTLGTVLVAVFGPGQVPSSPCSGSSSITGAR